MTTHSKKLESAYERLMEHERPQAIRSYKKALFLVLFNIVHLQEVEETIGGIEGYTYELYMLYEFFEEMERVSD